MMNKTNNIFARFILFALLMLGGVGKAWAVRQMPTFSADESSTEVWHYIVFAINKGNVKIYANTNTGKLNWISATETPTDDFRWYLIGNENDFILKSVSGYYAYTTETGGGQNTAYTVTTEATSATHFKLIYGDNDKTWSIRRISGGATDNNCLNHRGNNEIMEWRNDPGSSVVFVKQTNYLSFSPAPTATAWDADTKWYAVRNNRNNINYFNHKYLTTSAKAIRDNDFTITVRNLDEYEMPDDRGSYWCFVGNNTDGFYIQNAAYGPDFYLAYLGTSVNRYMMVHKNEIPANSIVKFTYDESNVIEEAGVAYMFRMGLTGNDNLHINDGDFCRYWNFDKNDSGSAFMLSGVSTADVDALTDYDVYKVEVTTGGKVGYKGTREVFGKRGSQPSPYFILAKGSPEVTQDDINTGREINNFTIDASQTATYLKFISIELLLPYIKHRQHAVFDHLAAIGDTDKPSNKFIHDGEGLIAHPYAADFKDEEGYTDNDRMMQNTSVFHITQYAKKGETTNVSLPHTRQGSLGKINKYQRWYDYTTERLLDEDIVSGLSSYTIYLNGHVKTSNIQGRVDIKLPSDKDEIIIAVDDSEFNDHSSDAEDNLIEPSLSMRTVIHVISAEKMADALVVKGENDEKWWEEKTYIVPNVKHGSAIHKNNSDLLPLDMPFSNYWIYNNSHNLMRIVNENGDYNTLSNNISIEVEGDAKNYITVGIFKSKGETGLDNPLGVRYNHFLYYKINGEGLTREVPAGTQAVIKVYASDGTSGTKYQLAKFTLNFQADSEPLAITSVIGNEKSTRSREYFAEKQMAEVASLTFTEKKVTFQWINGITQRDHDSQVYAFPIDPTRTSYAYSTDNAFGGYRITKQAYGMKTLPVSVYERNIKDGSTSLNVDDNDYYLYIDAAESPGQVASIPLDGSLCPGTRLFFYGWLTSQNPFEHGSSTAASVILELVGKKNGEDVVLATYLPGVVSDAAYTPEGDVIRSIKDGRTASTEAAYSYSYNLDGHGDDPTRLAAWQSIGFSYLLTESGFDGFELRVINNCFSTAGGDYSLDDFRVFVNPPRGNVDFTTPLCSDKVRHAKIHSDYDMLKNISGINDNSGTSLGVSYCFLEADVFDSYTEGGLTISDIFEIDAQTGNHNLKSEYQSNDAAKTLINNAFGKALVGTRNLPEDDPESHGFHTYDVNLDYESIPEYAYNDSKSEVIYREVGTDGIRSIVFKEDVIRGEMTPIEYDGQLHYPHLRPSTTYYLVFSPIPVVKDDIEGHTTGTNTFHIHESCSFFGKFTTKDPMHVILDNADIESDLPVTAVCHGETVEFGFDMPALKEAKKVNGIIPVYDEANCTSIAGEDGQEVPGLENQHYRYEPELTSTLVQTSIKDLPYDWWFGGKYVDAEHSIDTYLGGSFDEYMVVTHPYIKYSHPHDIAHKQDGEPVKIEQAMVDFRFYYPDFGLGKTDIDGNCTLTDDDWAELKVRDYNSETGYGLLQSEIDAIKDLVTRGILMLHRNTYNMPMTADKAVADGEQKAIYFTLIPIMPSQHNYVDQPYIYCPEPRGVKMKIYSNEPKMLDGFDGMDYPTTMENVPVRMGLLQMSNVPLNNADGANTLRVPLRNLQRALSTGKRSVRTADKGYGLKLYLTKTTDPAYQVDGATAGEMCDAKMITTLQDGETVSLYHTVGEIKDLKAVYGDTDNYMALQFDQSGARDIVMKEGHTYRLNFNYVEQDADDNPTLACYGVVEFDVKIVPEYQTWTGTVGNTEWTNDGNWQRADASILNAAQATAANAANANGSPLHTYITNAVNNTANSFVPMYFTNVLMHDASLQAPNLYKLTAPVAGTSFLSGLADGQATENIVYDMLVTPMDAANRTDLNFDCNYMCELFNSNECRGITFEPGTQLLHAENLKYKRAWVEYELDVNRWYTLGSPLQETYSGEWYTPTATGRENAPHFYNLYYDNAKDDRYRPAVYQRSWDKIGTANLYRADGTQEDVYVKGDWSSVYNDATVDYSTGGFSVIVDDYYMAAKPAGGKSLFRLPKADASYTYYTLNGSTGGKTDDDIVRTTAQYRLFSDDVTAMPSIRHHNADNEYALITNPFMAPMDVDAFLAANSESFEQKYWLVTENNQQVSVKTEDGWTGTGNGLIAPLQSFFVKLTPSAMAMQTGNGFRPVYTNDMQVSTLGNDKQDANMPRNIISLSAKRDGEASMAMVKVSDASAAGVVAAEDCEAFIDSNLEDVPTIYTVASAQAMSINSLPALDMVGIGIISNSDDDVTVTISGAAGKLLYDAQTGDYTDLSDDTEVTMPGNTSGRYFLTTTRLDNASAVEGNGQKYNILGQPVDTPRHGTIVIVDGKKRLYR